MMCSVKGCEREGTHHLVARVWAMGFPKSSPPITTTLGLQFCKDHALHEAGSQEIIGDRFWEALDAITKAKRLMPPDRASLEIVPVRGLANVRGDNA